MSAASLTEAPIVQARGIHKHFGALHVLKGVDLEVRARDLVFVIGPSGSGKSTLLRYLNRLEDPSGGSITVDGISLTVSALGGSAGGDWFEVSLIPTTLGLTTLGRKGPGDPVNLEVDVIAKHVEKLLLSGVRPAGATEETA